MIEPGGSLVIEDGDFVIELSLIPETERPPARSLLGNHFLGIACLGLSCLIVFPLVGRALKSFSPSSLVSPIEERPISMWPPLSLNLDVALEGRIDEFLQAQGITDTQRSGTTAATQRSGTTTAIQRSGTPLETQRSGMTKRLAKSQRSDRHDESALFTPELGRFLDALWAGGSLAGAELLNHYLTLDVGRRGLPRAEERALRKQVSRAVRDAVDGTQDHRWPKRLGTIKAHWADENQRLYHVGYAAVSDLLTEGRGNCQAYSVATALALILATEGDAQVQPVFIHTPGHVQPGIVYDGQLHVTEGTSRGALIRSIPMDSQEELVVTDARSELIAMISRMSTTHDFWSSPLADAMFIMQREGPRPELRKQRVRRRMSAMAAGVPGPIPPPGDRPLGAASTPISPDATGWQLQQAVTEFNLISSVLQRSTRQAESSETAQNNSARRVRRDHGMHRPHRRSTGRARTSALEWLLESESGGRPDIWLAMVLRDGRGESMPLPASLKMDVRGCSAWQTNTVSGRVQLRRLKAGWVLASFDHGGAHHPDVHACLTRALQAAELPLRAKRLDVEFEPQMVPVTDRD